MSEQVEGRERHSIRETAWRGLVKELPYIAMMVMGLVGVGLVSSTGQSLSFYWLFLAPLYGLMCVIGGWPHAHDQDQRIRLVWKQALHWFAFFIAMLVVTSPEVRGVENNNAAGLNLMTILASGTFVAGVHAEAWQICIVGVLLGLAVPAVAWIELSSFLIVLVIVLVAFVASSVLWALRHHGR